MIQQRGPAHCGVRLLVCFVGLLCLVTVVGTPTIAGNMIQNESGTVTVDARLTITESENELELQYQADEQVWEQIQKAAQDQNQSIYRHLTDEYMTGSLPVFADGSLEAEASERGESTYTLTFTDFSMNDAPGYQAAVANGSVHVIVQDGLSPAIHRRIQTVRYRVDMPSQITGGTADVVTGTVAAWHITERQPRIAVQSRLDTIQQESNESGQPIVATGELQAESEAGTDTNTGEKGPLTAFLGWAVIGVVALIICFVWAWRVRQRKIATEKAKGTQER